MTSNFLIGIPDIPRNCSTWTQDDNGADQAQTTLRPVYNTFKGPKYTYWYGSSTTVAHNIVYDMGSSTSTCNFVAIARLDVMLSQTSNNLRVICDYSSDNVTYAANVLDQNFTSTSLLKGPRTEDYFTTFTTSSAYRYWRMRFSYASGAITYYPCCSKIYLGNYFDMGTDSFDYKIMNVTEEENEFVPSSGRVIPVRALDPYLRVEIVWTGVTDAKTKEFFDKVDQYRHDTPVFLYNSGVPVTLNDHTTLFCWLRSATTSNPSNINDHNTITAVFEEALG